MGELKHGFGAAKMNKDADERIVPNGEYREALNIEINTSESSDVGSMQTLLGNTKITISTITPNLITPTATCVGSIADEQNNNLYYLVADPENFTDYILQYSSTTQTITPIVVDKYEIHKHLLVTSASTGSIINTHFTISNEGDAVNNITNIRPGMSIASDDAIYLGAGGGVLITGPVVIADGYSILKMERTNASTNPANPFIGWNIYLDQNQTPSNLFTYGFTAAQGSSPNLNTIRFYSDRVLNFGSTLITGINIIDGILFWTDGETEPKKIIIENFTKDTVIGKFGTHPSGEIHSFFNVYSNDLITTANPNGIIEYPLSATVNYDRRKRPSALEEEHITIIKKPPLHPPILTMSNTSDGRFTSTGASADLIGTTVPENFINYDSGHNLPVGTVKDIIFNSTPLPDYVIGDLVLLRKDDPFVSDDLDNFELIVEILEYNPTSSGNAKVKISFIQNDPVNLLDQTTPLLPVPPPEDTEFHSMLQQEKPLYEFKFPKFAFRYKYQDNQYSTYSPFSEVAFLPGDFDYYPKEGYNLGMINTLRSVYIMDFVTNLIAIPKDVIEIDILYKESNSTNIYLVKTVKYGDTEWDAKGSVINTSTAWQGAYTRGRIQITSEMVRSAIASNQLLRPWDNVPRTAKAQEIVGNRIVYANYLQNYNL